jgi:hypothetical protein
MPIIVYEDWKKTESNVREMVPDLVRYDQDEIIVNVGAMDKVDQNVETLVHDHEIVDVEEITDKNDANGETTKDEEVHLKISEHLMNLEPINRSEVWTKFETWNFLDLPEELVLKVLSYSKPKDLITSGLVSKKLRRISHDNSLWRRVNISKKIVKTDFLEFILNKECKSLNISNTAIFGSLSLHKKSQLREFDLNWSYKKDEFEVLEEILKSCGSLERLKMQGPITPKMAVSICENGKTLQVLNLFLSIGAKSSYLKIIKSCQQLKEFYLGGIYLESHRLYGLSDDILEIIAKHVPPKVELLHLSNLDVTDNHIKILLSRCKQIKSLHLRQAKLITDHSLNTIRENLNLTLEKLNLNDMYDNFTFSGFLELKSMPKLKFLILDDKHEEQLKYLRGQLPHMTITALTVY